MNQAAGHREGPWEELEDPIDDQFGVNHSGVAAADKHLAVAGCQNVLHPMDVGPVPQADQVVVTSLYHEQRGAIDAARHAALVNQQSQPRQRAGE
jgi:hypothetical protein